MLTIKCFTKFWKTLNAKVKRICLTVKFINLIIKFGLKSYSYSIIIFLNHNWIPDFNMDFSSFWILYRCTRLFIYSNCLISFFSRTEPVLFTGGTVLFTDWFFIFTDVPVFFQTNTGMKKREKICFEYFWITSTLQVLWNIYKKLKKFCFCLKRPGQMGRDFFFFFFLTPSRIWE